MQGISKDQLLPSSSEQCRRRQNGVLKSAKVHLEGILTAANQEFHGEYLHQRLPSPALQHTTCQPTPHFSITTIIIIPLVPISPRFFLCHLSNYLSLILIFKRTIQKRKTSCTTKNVCPRIESSSKERFTTLN